MRTTEFIAQHLIEVFEGGNWTDVNLNATFQDINYKEATTVTKASYNTIAALVYHISFYNEIVLKRLYYSGDKIIDILKEVGGKSLIMILMLILYLLLLLNKILM